MRKSAVALAVLTALTLLGVPAASQAAGKCTVAVSTNMLTGKSTAIISPLNNNRIHRVLFIYPTTPTQDVTKTRGRTTVFNTEEAPAAVVAFRGSTLCKTGSMVGIG